MFNKIYISEHICNNNVHTKKNIILHLPFVSNTQQWIKLQYFRSIVNEI